MIKKWDQVDNSATVAKIELRRRFLPKQARVLDCFCGDGNMYRGAYAGNVAEYHGLDRQKIHSPDLCTLTDNIAWIRKNDIGRYNVFDMDDYGSPRKLLYYILKHHPQDRGELHFIVTDGAKARQKVNGTPEKFIAAIERVPASMNLPGLASFYIDVFGTMLKDIETRFACCVEKAVYFENQKKTVFYWYIKIVKIPRIV